MPVGIAKLGFRFNPTLMPPLRWIQEPGEIGNQYEETAFEYRLRASASQSRIATYTLQAGTIPAGIVLNQYSGILSGTLSAVEETVTHTFTIRVTTELGATMDGEFSFVVRKFITEVVWTTPEGEIASLPLGATTVNALHAESTEVS